MRYYQKPPLSLPEIVDRIDVGDPERVSRVILSVSPCRSGTTVFLRVFGYAGIESHYQELKNVLRWRLHGKDTVWQIPQRPGDTIYLKETIGPHTEIESRFNPLDVLLEAGFPPEKLHVVILGRAPSSTWSSWYEWWGEGATTVENFILAYTTVERVRRQAEQQGIPLTVLVYEAIRDNGAETVVKGLFKRLDVPYSATAVGGWRNLPAFGAPGSNVILPARPPSYHSWGREDSSPYLHARAEKSAGLAYFSREKRMCDLRADDVGKIAAAGLAEIYEEWRAACERDLGVEVEITEWECFR